MYIHQWHDLDALCTSTQDWDSNLGQQHQELWSWDNFTKVEILRNEPDPNQVLDKKYFSSQKTGKIRITDLLQKME